MSNHTIATVIRTIHPVGQGAFYTEEFFDCNNERAHTVVYDCGSRTKIGRNNCIKKVVSGSFAEKQHIDVLFISHFDEDHINGIKYLWDNDRNIDYVVIPQLKGLEWFYVVEAAFNNDYSLNRTASRIYHFINNIKANGAKVIQVRPISSNEIDSPRRESFNQDVLDEDRGGESPFPNIDETYRAGDMVNSGKIFGLCRNTYWIYIPINYTYDKDIQKLHDDLQEILKSDTDITKKKLEDLDNSEICEFIENNSKIINKLYNDVFPNTNASSLCLYSSSLNGSFTCQYRQCMCYFSGIKFLLNYEGYRASEFLYFLMREVGNIEGCLYTGDSNMTGGRNLVKLKFILNTIHPWLNHFGTFQIPHHGSKENLGKDSMEMLFDKDMFLHRLPKICFASYGSANSYGHPSDGLLTNLYTYNTEFVGVTEKKDSTLRQKIIVLNN